MLDWIVESVAVLGADYQARIRRAFAERWIDVYENQGKHSGAYSAAVYGVHPYMLLNWNDTLDSVFTLAHEMGHSMHTMLSHETQPFVYSSYTIFVAEVPSTLSEALLLDYMLARATDPRERIVLLQHAIDEVTSTFYRQVLFANYELEAHRLVERGEPITAETPEHAVSRPADATSTATRSTTTTRCSRVTWARIPHFFGSPYYVYQYATCFASSARLLQDVCATTIRRSARTASRAILDLLRAGQQRPPDGAAASAAGVDLRSRRRSAPSSATSTGSSAGSRPSWRPRPAVALTRHDSQTCRPHHRRQRRDRPRPDHRASPPKAASRSSRST